MLPPSLMLIAVFMILEVRRKVVIHHHLLRKSEIAKNLIKTKFNSASAYYPSAHPGFFVGIVISGSHSSLILIKHARETKSIPVYISLCLM